MKLGKGKNFVPYYFHLLDFPNEIEMTFVAQHSYSWRWHIL